MYIYATCIDFLHRTAAPIQVQESMEAVDLICEYMHNRQPPLRVSSHTVLCGQEPDACTTHTRHCLITRPGLTNTTSAREPTIFSCAVDWLSRISMVHGALCGPLIYMHGICSFKRPALSAMHEACRPMLICRGNTTTSDMPVVALASRCN